DYKVTGVQTCALPIYVEEAAQARADDQGVEIEHAGDGARGHGAAAGPPCCARFTNRLSNVSRCEATDTSRAPDATMCRIASCAGGSAPKVKTSTPSRCIVCVACGRIRSATSGGTPCATTSTARTPGSRSELSEPQS